MKPAKAILIPSLANCIAIYDFTLFPVLLPIFAEILFTNNSYFSAIELGYVVFAISFLIVPFSSIFWGYYGDKFGGGGLMKYTLLIMAFPSLMIALTPSYSVIGFWAILIAILARILQGISASAEVLGSKIYAFSNLDAKCHLLASSVITAFGALGVLFALYMGALCSNSDYLFRYAFLIGSLTFIVIPFIRKKKIKRIQKKITLKSVWAVISHNKLTAIYTFTLSGVLGLLSYTIHAFMVAYSIRILDSNFIYYPLVLALTLTILTAFVIGLLSLRYNISEKHFVKWCLISLTILCAPLFYFIDSSIYHFYITIALLSIILGVFAPVCGVVVIKSFSEDERFRGALIVNAFGVAIFGGTAPVILKILSNYNTLLCGIYLTILFFISLLITHYYEKSSTN